MGFKRFMWFRQPEPPPRSRSNTGGRRGISGGGLSVHKFEIYLNQKGSSTMDDYHFIDTDSQWAEPAVFWLASFHSKLNCALTWFVKLINWNFRPLGNTAATHNWFIAIFMGYESIILNRIHSVPVLNLLYHSEDRLWKLWVQKPFLTRGCQQPADTFWSWISKFIEWPAQWGAEGV